MCRDIVLLQKCILSRDLIVADKNMLKLREKNYFVSVVYLVSESYKLLKA